MPVTLRLKADARPGDRSFVLEYDTEPYFRKGDSVTVNNGKGLSFTARVQSDPSFENLVLDTPVPEEWANSQKALAWSASIVGGAAPAGGPGGTTAPTVLQTLTGLTDTQVIAPKTGQILIYSGGMWKNRPMGGLDDLSDVTLGAPTAGSVLSFVGGVWKAAPPAPDSLATLSDTNIPATIPDGNILAWDQATSKWLPVTPAAGGGATTMASLTDTNIAGGGPAPGQMLTWNGTTSKWTPTNVLRTLVALDDVAAPATITDGWVLTWEDTSKRWKPKVVPAGVTTLDGLTDTNLGTPTASQVLAYNAVASKWEPSDRIDTLTELTDVTAPTPADGQVLAWSAAASQWGPSTVSAAGTIGLNGLSDVDTMTAPPTAGQALVWNDTNKAWEPGTVATTGQTLSTLADVDVTTTPITDGQILKWDDTAKQWVPTNLGGGSVATLTDVDLTTAPPTADQVLKFVPAVGGAPDHWVPVDPVKNIEDLANVDPDHTFTTIEGMILVWNDTDKLWESRLPAAGTSIGTGDIDFGAFHATNIADPRTGLVGAQDATTRDWVTQQIAAQNLYQGIYKPRNNTPDLRALTDAQDGANPFALPAAGDIVGAPNVGLPTPAGTDIQVWFEFGGQGMNTFPATINQPIKVTIYFSDLTTHEFNLAPATYRNVGDLENALATHIAGTPITHIRADNTGGLPWIGIETAAPLYTIGMSPSTNTGFTDATPGTGNTVLNSYSWVVSTLDPNVPEPAPPGLPGIESGTLLANSDTIQWSAAANAFQVLKGGNLTQAFADTRYWRTTAGNMQWRDQAYSSGSVVLAHDAWWRAIQNIPVGNGEPGSVQAGVSWKKINATYGSTTFFGKGDFDDTDTSAANNWGMPAQTYPAGQQPVNGDVYFDITTGATATFRVTENAPVFILSDTVDIAAATNLGDAFIGGAPDVMNWAVDGTAIGAARNDYYKITIPAPAFSFNLAGAKKGDIATAADLVDKGTAGMVQGDFYAVTSAVTGNTAGDPWIGIAAAAGSALVYTGSPQLKSIAAVEGWEIRNGWILVPNPPGPGAQLQFNLHLQAPQGGFAGDTFQVGDKLVVWTGDPDADNGGWVMIPDTAPRSWSVNTPHAQQTPDTVRATVERGYEVRFNLTVDAGVAADKTVVLFKGVKTEPAVYEVTVIDTDSEGAVYRSLITLSHNAAPSLSPETIIKRNSHFKTIELGWMGASDNYGFAANIKGTEAQGKSYRIILSSDNHDLDGITGGDGTEIVTAWPQASYVDKVDAQKDYPGQELEDFLKAKSGDAQASQLDPTAALGADMQGNTVALTGGKLYQVSGFWIDVNNDSEAFVSVNLTAAGASGKNKLTEADFMFFYKDRNKLNNSDSISDGSQWPLEPSNKGWFATAWGGPKKNTWYPFWLTLDLRDPEIHSVDFKSIFIRTKDTGYNKVTMEWGGTFPASLGAKTYYFSQYNGHEVHWKVYNNM